MLIRHKGSGLNLVRDLTASYNKLSATTPTKTPNLLNVLHKETCTKTPQTRVLIEAASEIDSRSCMLYVSVYEKWFCPGSEERRLDSYSLQNKHPNHGAGRQAGKVDIVKPTNQPTNQWRGERERERERERELPNQRNTTKTHTSIPFHSVQYIHIHIYIYIYVYLYVCMYVSMCIHISVYV